MQHLELVGFVAITSSHSSASAGWWQGPASKEPIRTRCIAPVKQYTRLLLLEHTCIGCQHTQGAHWLPTTKQTPCIHTGCNAPIKADMIPAHRLRYPKRL